MKPIWPYALFGLGALAAMFAWFVSAIGQATEECEDGSSSPLLPGPGRTDPSSHVRPIDPPPYDWAAFEAKLQGRDKR